MQWADNSGPPISPPPRANSAISYRDGYLTRSADIADLRLSGIFRLKNTDTLLAILPQTLPVQLRYRTRWWVTLERQA